MPNHVKNIVRISGSEKDIARCSELIFKGGQFSFQNIKPMPEELNVESGSMSHNASEWMKADKEGRKRIEEDIAEGYGISRNEAKARLQRYADNVSKYGCITWYEWCCEHWGTKWDAYEISEVSREKRFMQIEFWTAWSTPQAVIETLAEQFPGLTISVDFADEDMGNNCGSYGFVDGTQWEDVGDYEFACEVWGCEPEEEECEEIETL